ncbi:Aflatoxin biosynthesis regulatory protein [Penicillium griseofulvum]|uniref:Aflatoxin biosynthesis regulatory protein n=1 Tax=Penicillium patulum TaxID=5078 RepID=A0A135LEC5_PENPA|nr:Aflatoxin biosynthesis regulatory protein [Penicillium griseofulvum]KXG47309.1 Aflatoxin biosynthesis regulatory protein [Penicillium griseofulvum]
MAGDSIRSTRPEKLRSSCDRCGTAKVKCDKEQPECGRCISHGVPCIYGVSRKMGKPPRRVSLSRSTSDTVTTTQSSSETSSGGMPLDLEPSPRTDMNTWDHMDEDSSQTFIDILDAGGILNHNLPIPMIPNLPLDYNEWTISDQTSVNVLCPFRSSQQSPTQGEDLTSMAFQWQWDGSVEQGSISPEVANDHDCQRKSHEILESLSVHNIGKSEADELPPPAGFALKTETTVNGVPLDLVLQLNREATERLIQLVSCPCARIPSVALLYASIISRILAWYEQAACCTQPSPLSSLASTTAGSILTSSDSSRGASSPPMQPPEVSVAPSRMMIGTFNVDDPRLQTMMNIHLLSGEMKRVKDVIDQFGSQTGCSTPATGQIGGLCLSLNSWLKQDYSRILHMMQAELRELSI